MKIGYIRVSTRDQNTARQEFLLAKLGVEELYIDRMSGKSSDRPELQKMLSYVRRGDTIVWNPSAALPATPETCWIWWSI